jgi:hypothetical protein
MSSRHGHLPIRRHNFFLMSSNHHEGHEGHEGRKESNTNLRALRVLRGYLRRNRRATAGLDMTIRGSRHYIFLSVNLNDELSVRIDVAAIHAVAIKGQRHRAVLVDGNETTLAAKPLCLVEGGLRGFL